MNNRPDGGYFTANDAVLPWAWAFLESFREANPSLPLRLIPFGGQIDELSKWQERFDFELHSDGSYSALDDLGQRYELGHTPHGKYWFRRYAAFWGPFERFWYLDVRQLVLSNLGATFRHLDHFDLVHYDTALNQVYEPGSHRHQLLTERRGRGFNSGRWMARKGAFTLEEMLRLGEDSLKIRDQLNPRNTDQAFINYCCDHKPLKTAHLAELDGELASNGWARSHPQVYQDRSDWRVWDHGGLDHRKKLILLHWAGIPDTPLMPHRRLFRRFRDLGRPLAARLGSRLGDGVRWPVLAMTDGLRRNRHVNTWIHRLRGKAP